MKKIFTAATIEEAKEKAAEEFSVSVEEITFNVLEEPRKGFFGKLKGEGKVEAEYTKPQENDEKSADTQEDDKQQEDVQSDKSESLKKKIECSKEYIEKIINKMGIENVVVKANETENGVVFEIESSEFEQLIGKKGELLDSMQYLASLVCNKIDREYFRISLDCGGFREKRKAQLEELAKKIAENVKRTGRSAALEPMNPYERRIIHAAVAEIEGVTSQSKGEEPWRKVIISSTAPRKFNDRNGGGRRNGGRGQRRGAPHGGRPQKAFDITTSFEKDYKKPKPEDSMTDSALYSKIEF